MSTSSNNTLELSPVDPEVYVKISRRNEVAAAASAFFSIMESQIGQYLSPQAANEAPEHSYTDITPIKEAVPPEISTNSTSGSSQNIGYEYDQPEQQGAHEYQAGLDYTPSELQRIAAAQQLVDEAHREGERQ